MKHDRPQPINNDGGGDDDKNNDDDAAPAGGDDTEDTAAPDAYDSNWDLEGYKKLFDAKHAFMDRGKRVLDAPHTIRQCFGNVVQLIEKHTRAAEATLQQFRDRASPDFAKALQDLAEGKTVLLHHLFDFDAFIEAAAGATKTRNE